MKSPSKNNSSKKIFVMKSPSKNNSSKTIFVMKSPSKNNSSKKILVMSGIIISSLVSATSSLLLQTSSIAGELFSRKYSP